MNATQETAPSAKSKAKLTTSFKCAPEYLESLDQQCEAACMSRSAFIEAKLLDSERAEAELSVMRQKLSVYESPKLKEHLKKLMGRPIRFIDLDGNEINVTVNSLQDVYKILVHSFQIGNNL